MKRASRPPRRAATPGTGPHPRRWTPRWGPSRPVVPRDRAGTFTPRPGSAMGQRRLDGLDAMIISLYAGGMTVRDIQHHLASTLSVELSAGTISRITDAVADAVARVAAPPAGGVLPGDLPQARFGPMVRVNHRVASRSAHIAVGAGHGRYQARGLSIWAPGPRKEPPSGHMCAPVPAQPQRRGVPDRRGGTSRTGAKRAGECDGLTGLPEANAGRSGPQATVPTCVVHPVPCPWMRFVSYGESRKVAAALKTVYTAPNQEAAWQALTDFSESDLDRPPTP